MPAKAVQISIDSGLLDRVDADPETRAHGRSAFVRTALEHYLARKHRVRLDTQIVTAYGDQAEAMRAETSDLMDGQAWPDD